MGKFRIRLKSTLEMKKYILGFYVTMLSITNIANCQTIWDNNVSSFNDGYASVELNGKYGSIDKSGEIVIPCVYENYFIEFDEGLAVVKKNGKYGFIDKSGKLIIPCMYDNAGGFSEGLALVLSNNLWGYIDKKNKLVIPFQYQEAYPFSNGLAAVSSGKGGLVRSGGWSDGEEGFNFLYGFIDKTNRLIYPEKFEAIIPPGKAYVSGINVTSFSDSVCIAKHYELGWSILDAKGGIKIIDKKFEKPETNFYYSLLGKQFEDGLTVVFLNGKFGYANKDLEIQIPCIYDRAEPFSEGFAAVQINGKYGFIDKIGKLQIACIYEGGYYPRFSEGLACVKINGIYGAINKEGATIIPFEYDYSDFYFSDGLAMVFLNGKRRFINTSNKCVLNCDQ